MKTGVMDGLPKYVQKRLKLNSLGGNIHPSDDDVGVTLEAFRGKQIHEFQETRGIGTVEVLASITRVRDALRRGEIPQAIQKEFPQVVEWQLTDYPYEPGPPPILKGPRPPDGSIRPREGGTARALALPPENSVPGVSAIMQERYDDPEPDDPRSLHRFIEQVRRVAAIPMAKLLGRELCLRLAAHDSLAIRHAMEFLGLARSGGARLTLAQQFNLGEKGEPKTPSRTGLSFEKLLREAEAQDPSGFGMGQETAEIAVAVEDEEEQE